MQQVLGQLTEKSIFKSIWRIIFLTWLDIKGVKLFNCVLACHVFSVPAPSLQLLGKNIWSLRYQKYRASEGLDSKSLVPLLARHASQAFLVMLEDGKIKWQASSLSEP